MVIIYPPSLTYLLFSNDIIGRITVGLICVVLFAFYLQKWDYFSKHDPDRLHSEEYLAKIKEIEMTQRQGQPPEEAKGLKIVEPPKRIAGGE
jgi:hypothetical protein